MATLRYVAIISDNPNELAGFYREFLRLKDIGGSPEGDVSLTDGFYNFTLLKRRAELREPRMETGLHHIGLEAESLDEIKARYFKFNPRGVLVAEPEGIHHGELRIYDPECNPVSLSTKGFGVKQESRLPRIRHIAYNALDPERMLQFYSEVLGLRELPTSYARRQQGLGNRFAGDGFTNLAIHPFYSPVEGHESRFGINHVGFLVSDMKAAIDGLASVVTIDSRPATRPYAEFRFRDPEGNALDLSQSKGWEVDVNKWERAA
jgi:catechol 2,3-dioxygenase-like lactoylglutathione lyase family enzyme